MLKQNAARNLMVFLTDSSDHVTGKTGATLTITLSKDGAAFTTISPTVTERGNGWYNLALTTSHTDTQGDLVVRAEATSADPIDLREEVFAGLPGDNVVVSAISPDAISASAVSDGAVTKIQNGLALATLVSAVKAKTDSLVFTVAGQVDANIQYVNDIQVQGVGTSADPWNPV